jgi:UDP-N-acetylglucosamine--N-acetylmuramyl-(pentapeptide) pyrophosphoryl-undecaprenol N-acetylglucosamine transferase
MALSAADLIISRAGAGSIAEILIAEKPSVLIPLPTAADNHQKFNALEIKEQGAAEVIEENLINTLTFIDLLRSLLIDRERLKKMSESIRQISRPDAALNIAKVVLNK